MLALFLSLLIRFGSFGTESCHLDLKTTEFVKGTSLETIESQAQLDQLYQELANGAQAHRGRETSKVIQARAAFDLVACDRDEDMIDLSHKAKVQKRESYDNESIINPVTESQSKERSQKMQAIRY